MAATAAVAALVVTAGSAAYSINAQEQAKKEQRDQMGKQQKAQDDLLAQQKQQQDAQTTAEDQIRAQAEDARKRTAALSLRDESRSRQKALSVGSGGRRGTILTSPLGETNPTQNLGQKTLLGQ